MIVRTENRIRTYRRLLMLGSMADKGVAYSTVQFMANVYDLFFEKPQRTCKELAESYSITPQAARHHVNRLTELGYLTRVHYRAWEVNSDGIMSLALQ